MVIFVRDIDFIRYVLSKLNVIFTVYAVL